VGATALLACGACGRIHYGPLDAAPLDAAPLDAASLDAGPRDASPLDGSTDASEPLPAFGASFAAVVEQRPVNTATREFGVSMSPDGLRIVFASYATGPTEPMRANLYLGSRGGPGELFSARTLLTDVSTDMDEGEPTWAAGGAEIYFDRGADSGIRRCTLAGDACTGTASIPNLEAFGGADVAVGETHLVVSRAGDLFEAVRASPLDPWPVPAPIVELAGPEQDGFPSLREDGLEIFWERDAPTIPSIWRAVRPSIDAPFGPAERVSFVGLSGPTGDPDIDATGTTLVFVASPESGGTGEFDIFLARRTPR
jgi:hypothetical protein